jgi:acetylornithine deacetylase/succinyl-diaminopimelate desuccinylase-like protein
MMLRGLVMACVGVLALVGCGSVAPPPGPPPVVQPDRAAFRELYRELVETNTTASSGDCTLAARRMADRLRRAGYPDSDLNVFVPPGHPKDGGLIATLHGADPARKAILLLAHIDVVEAQAQDWGRDPFKLVEDGGYFTARGANDDKAMAAIWVDSLIRYRAEGFTPKRNIKVALTCGEEGGGQVNGVEWLMQNHRDWIDAAFALNEGANGTLDDQNNRAAALTRLGAFAFPVLLNEVTRSYFERLSGLTDGATGQAMKALGSNPNDTAAATTLSTTPLYNAMMRTTCVVTKIQGGHAPNALPQQAQANVNCRIFPGTPGAEVRQTLLSVVNDPKVTVEPVKPYTSAAPVPPLSEAILGPVREVSSKMWPHVPLLPTMSVGATDGRFLNHGGIPTYGLSGRFFRPGDHHNHGLNERIPVRSLYEARDFLYEVTKLYTNTS